MRKSVPHEQELRAARRAALAAGKFLRRQFLRRKALRVELKGRADYVSRADRGSERIIRRIILRKFPDDGFLAEEGGLRRGRGERRRWLVDPLDGTTNFLHRFPVWAVSIAAAVDGDLVAALVHHVPADTRYTAVAGGGALQDGVPIAVSPVTDPRHALIGTGFPFRDIAQLDTYQAQFAAVVAGAAGLRRPGSAALDLCWVASGRYEGFWELRLAPWDVAAGTLLVREAGGVVTDLAGRADVLSHSSVVAGNPSLHSWLLTTLAVR
jgi:myo-inositol-1(or 4)-monophosphatase